MSIHEAIKARRLALGLSMDALANQVNELQPADEKPISRQTVQHWEKGGAAPKRKRLEAVAAALQTTPDALLFGIASPQGADATKLTEQEKTLLADFDLLTSDEKDRLLAEVHATAERYRKFIREQAQKKRL